MKIREIINYLKNIDPCGEKSTCLVKAACHLRQGKPWKRATDCPDYKKYIARNHRTSTILSETIEWFWICFMVVAFITICFIFYLGSMKLIKIIWNILT